MSVNAIDCSRLTGQTLYTIEVFKPLRNIWSREREWTRASISAVGLSWMSKYIYRYHLTMLHNLSPREAATLRWPLYSWPPPHFLVGYQKLVQICNDYIFDTRAYSRLKYTENVSLGQHLVNWSTMSNCTYTLNTGAYHRFLDMDDFQQSLAQIQQAVLTERIVADLALLHPLRGFGTTQMGEDRDIPVEQFLQDQFKDIGTCQDQAWGMADRVRIQRAGRKDLILLKTIRRLKAAYFNFLIASFLPHITELDLPCDCFWIESFVDKFADISTAAENNFSLLNSVPLQILLKCITDVLSLPHPSGTSGLTGGAFTLRPREGNRAVTETMRRQRGEMIERFIDALPVRRRRRRVPIVSPPIEPESSSPPILSPSPPAPNISFTEEVRAAVAEAIRLLEDELTVSARQHEFFNFAIHFYNVIQRLEAIGEVNELTIRRWVMYFFVAEHIATTLNYLHHSLRVANPFSRHVMLNMAQVVMRARNEQGQLIYSRVWNEGGENAFIRIMARISIDLAATVERAGQGDLDEEEIEQFMSDIALHENSGDVSEILRQVATNDAVIDSMELSFRFRVTGPVVFTQNQQIRQINSRVIAHATLLRQQHLPLPDLHAPVHLNRGGVP
ncbi:pTP [Bottlenose dolphin adenovirus 1]|uniref:Preterminal protein n=1 Tax=Bottlenose dolphin adenovirus 1 TaxID=1714377 RepID=A0A1X7MMI1_9ADEN|nr:pTP [Bottlenose dolphin adenovirus 1]SMG83441.1 pTP [Bottlenose dolphin adenovirus 1]